MDGRTLEQVGFPAPAADGADEDAARDQRDARPRRGDDDESAPEGERPGTLASTCVQTDPQATGYNVLRSVFPVRTSAGLICGIDGYPTIECADVVSDSSSALDPNVTSPTESTPTSSPIPVVIVALIIGVGGGFIWQLRRRK